MPGIYTKLLDVDKVDLVVGPYATNMIAPAMPVVMQKGKTYHRPVRARGEQRVPLSEILLDAADRPERRSRRSRDGFFQVAAAAESKPQTVALAAEDAEFARNACEGARDNAKKYDFKIVYDKTYPPGTTDFSPIIRAMQAANADLVIACSYPLSSVGIVQCGQRARTSRRRCSAARWSACRRPCSRTG